MIQCPHCTSTRITKSSTLKSGSIRLQCLDCKRSFTPDPKPPGRPVTGKAKTDAERMREYRKRLKEKRENDEK